MSVLRRCLSDPARLPLPRVARVKISTAQHYVPQGDKSSYTDKQKRMAGHIEEGYEKRGVSHETAEQRAWATVNKLTGGGRQSGSGRRHAAAGRSR